MPDALGARAAPAATTARSGRLGEVRAVQEREREAGEPADGRAEPEGSEPRRGAGAARAPAGRQLSAGVGRALRLTSLITDPPCIDTKACARRMSLTCTAHD